MELCKNICLYFHYFLIFLIGNSNERLNISKESGLNNLKVNQQILAIR